MSHVVCVHCAVQHYIGTLISYHNKYNITWPLTTAFIYMFIYFSGFFFISRNFSFV